MKRSWKIWARRAAAGMIAVLAAGSEADAAHAASPQPDPPKPQWDKGGATPRPIMTIRSVVMPAPRR